MVYRSIRLAVLINLFLIILTASPLIYLLTGPRYYFAAYLIPLLILEVWVILRNMDLTNRSISYFFDAVKNDDTSLNFPTEVKNKDLKKIHENLNKVNRIIHDIKTKNIAKEKFYLNLIQHSATGLIAVDPSGNIILMNQKGYDFAGIPSNLSPDQLKIKNSGLYSVLDRIRGGETILEKSRIKGRICYISIRSSEMKMPAGVYKLISLQDIKQELDERELDSWIRLIRILTHEIMNSIAPITSLSDTIKKYFINNNRILGPEQITRQLIQNTVDGLGVIEERGKGLLEFVNNFRKLTKVPQPNIKPVNLEKWLTQIKTLLQQEIVRNNIIFEMVTDRRITEIEMDENLLTQVVINIINNAVDALKDKGTNRKISLHVMPDANNRVAIRISNNGNPIPEDISDRIFIPFFTTKESGSGIGLSLSLQIVRLHGGQLFLETVDGLTNFTILL